MSSDVFQPDSIDESADSDPGSHLVGDDISLPVPAWADPVFAGVLSVVSAVAIGIDWLLIAFVPWAVVLGLIAAIDFRELRVPNQLLKLGFMMAAPLVVLAVSLTTTEVSLTRGIWAGLISLGLFGLCHLASPRSLGMGDVKLAPYIGLHLGLFSWELWYRGLFFGFVFVSVAGVGAMIAARIGRRACLPFAPFMAAGAVTALYLA